MIKNSVNGAYIVSYIDGVPTKEYLEDFIDQQSGNPDCEMVFVISRNGLIKLLKDFPDAFPSGLNM